MYILVCHKISFPALTREAENGETVSPVLSLLVLTAYLNSDREQDRARTKQKGERNQAGNDGKMGCCDEEPQVCER